MKIKLSENKLKQIIAETVKKVLFEGKFVNNKPYFYSNKLPVKPGEMVDDEPNSFETDNHDLYWPNDENNKGANDRAKHNDRVHKYDIEWYEDTIYDDDGNASPFTDCNIIPNYGRVGDEKRYKDQKRQREVKRFYNKFNENNKIK